MIFDCLYLENDFIDLATKWLIHKKNPDPRDTNYREKTSLRLTPWLPYYNEGSEGFYVMLVPTRPFHHLIAVYGN